MQPIKTQVKILSAQSKPYDLGNGISGVSHKVRFLTDTEIFNIKTTEQIVNEINSKNIANKTATVELKLSSPKEKLQLELVSLETK